MPFHLSQEGIDQLLTHLIFSSGNPKLREVTQSAQEPTGVGDHLEPPASAQCCWKWVWGPGKITQSKAKHFISTGGSKAMLAQVGNTPMGVPSGPVFCSEQSCFILSDESLCGHEYVSEICGGIGSP